MADISNTERESILLRKLRSFETLPDAGADAIIALEHRRIRQAAAKSDIIHEGEDPREVFLILSGWACRYKVLEDGRRQIVSIFLPGDLCDLHVYILKEMDHSIAAMSTVRYAQIGSSELEAISDEHPRVMRALWWETLVAAAIQREWTVTVGQRDAYEALAHLVCELYLRLRLVGFVEKHSCACPMTHADFADALGITPTHAGRMIRELNKSGLATIARRSISVHDLAGLIEAGNFNMNYLHLQNDVA
jgi:CRP-like cAMP-binding protein